jgi:hypothetical protein
MLKRVNDYLPILQEQFPNVPLADIKRAVEYGWRMIYYYNLRGCDTVISSTKHKYWFYIGELTKNSLKHFNYYRRMLRRKLRVIYSKKVKEWDGYYYFGLTESEYSEFLESLNKRGRKRKHYTFFNKVCLKVFDEAKIYYSWSRCIIKYRPTTDLGYSIFKSEFKCECPEIAFTRDKPSTFKDILISSNNYELIKYEKGSS